MALRRWSYTLLYLGKPRWDTGVSPPELLNFIQNQLCGRALDLGCGTGTNAITLAKHGWEVVGIDFISIAIRQARRKARTANLYIDFQRGDVTDLRNILGSFDLVLDIGCYHSLPPVGRKAYIANLDRLLSPGGTFLLYGFLNTRPEKSDRGIKDEDICQLSRRLTLSVRQDGFDHKRPSTWIILHKPING
jgi:SAM-dependent methyltransferase